MACSQKAKGAAPLNGYVIARRPGVCAQVDLYAKAAVSNSVEVLGARNLTLEGLVGLAGLQLSSPSNSWVVLFGDIVVAH